MPTTSPRLSNSGLPELPGLMATSVWMKGTSPAPPTRRSTALTTPAVTLPWNPNGALMAATQSPGASREESPMTAADRPVASIFSRPTSVRLSAPTTRAVKCRPSSRRTWASSMFTTTCALVRIRPSLLMITPEARSRIWLMRTLAGSGQARRSAKSRSGAISSSMSSGFWSRPMRSVLMSTTEALRLATSEEKAGEDGAAPDACAVGPATVRVVGAAAHAASTASRPAQAEARMKRWMDVTGPM